MYKIIFISFLFLSSCVGNSIAFIPLQTQENSCQITHIQPTIFSAYASQICYNDKGRVISTNLTKGRSMGEIGLNALNIGASVAGLIGLISNLPD